MPGILGILSKPLSDMFTESGELTEACKKEMGYTEGCKKEGCKSEGCQKEGCKTEGGCKKEGCQKEEGDLTASDMQKLADEADKEKPLTPEDNERIDQTIALAATNWAIRTSDEEPYQAFKESADCFLACEEGYFTEKTIVKFDKKDKKKQLLKIAVFAIAKEKNDPLYKKLITVWKMERTLEAALTKKYKSQAEARVKTYLTNAKKSKVGFIRTLGKKLSGGEKN